MYELKVKCTNCESIMYEEYIVAHENGEDGMCPCCGSVNTFMDLNKREDKHYYNNNQIKTSKGIVTTETYDDQIAQGVKILLDDIIVAMLDVYTDGSETRILVYADKDLDEPTECININI